jgi:ABC-2 type transport system permease protein
MTFLLKRSGMRKVWLVIKREYLTRVRTRAFFLATVLIPLLLLGYFALVVFVSRGESGSTLKIALVDEAGGLAQAISDNLQEKLPNGEPDVEVVESLENPGAQAKAELRARVLSGKLGAYLIIPKGILRGKEAEFYTRNPWDLTRTGSLRRAVSEAVVSRRLSEQGVHVKDLAQVTAWSDIRLVKLTMQGQTVEGSQTLIMGFVAAMLLYGTLIIYGVSTMRSVLEEKTTHIVEILVSSLRPAQLLGGKILGVAAVGLTQYLIWTLCGALLAAYGASLASAFRPNGLPSSFHIPVSLFIFMTVFFMGGYFLYSALYATVGAVVSTEQDAQQMQIPVILPLVLSLVLLNVILRDSNSTASVVLSMIPFFSPILMIFRITLQTPPFWQIGLSLALLMATTLGAVWFSARIYRVGILMYGKRPSLLEVLRWLRYS